MTQRILVFYGSYRSDRMGIRLAQFVVEGFEGRGDDVELIDAKAVGLPMLDRMYKDYPNSGSGVCRPRDSVLHIRRARAVTIPDAAFGVPDAACARRLTLDRMLQSLPCVVDFLTKHPGTGQYGPVSTVISSRTARKPQRAGPFGTRRLSRVSDLATR